MVNGMPHIYGIDRAGENWSAAAGRLAENVAEKHVAEVDEQGRYPAEAMQALAEGGFFGLCLPSEFGGQSQPPRVFAAVVEELARRCASTAMIYVMHGAASQVLAASTTLADREALLWAICEGMHLTTLAFSEQGSRSQFWAPVSRLEPSEDAGFLTSARKSWVTSAQHADTYVCTAQKPDAGSPLESTLYLLRRDNSGVRTVGTFNGLGLRGNDSAPVEIDSAYVPRGDLLTEPGSGGEMVLGVVLPWFAIGTAAMAHGLCLASVAATAAHLSATGLAHNGSRLRDLPNLRARLADMSVRTEQSRALLGFTLSLMEHGDPQTPVYVLQSRTAALQAAVDVTDLAMKACGGAAFSKHLGIERLFRDARAGWVMAPTVDHLGDFIGRSLTGMPLFG
jgi:alkylation response protein AidB-like acyl-CoA dehydrogenase